MNELKQDSLDFDNSVLSLKSDANGDKLLAEIRKENQKKPIIIKTSMTRADWIHVQI